MMIVDEIRRALATADMEAKMYVAAKYGGGDTVVSCVLPGYLAAVLSWTPPVGHPAHTLFAAVAVACALGAAWRFRRWRKDKQAWAVYQLCKRMGV